MQVDFYQLGRTPMPRVLGQIAGRVLAGGGRLLVVTEEDAATLDAALWEGDDSFLPHGRATARPPARSRGRRWRARTRPRSAPAGRRRDRRRWRGEALGFDRAFHLFDADTLDAARAAWRELGKADGVERNFWAQDEQGRWGKRA